MDLTKNAKKIYESKLFIWSDEYTKTSTECPVVDEASAKSFDLSEQEMLDAVQELVDFGYAKWASKKKNTFYKHW